MKIRDAIDRPRTYLGETGLPWLMSGLIFSLLGGSALIQHRLPLDGQLVLQLVTVGCAAAVFWGARRLKQSIVFPRGGYVKPANVAWKKRDWGYAAVTLAGLVVLYSLLRIVTRADPAQLSGPAFAICFAGICAGAGRQMRWPQMYWFAWYFLCLGAMLLWMPLSVRSMPTLEFGAGVPVAAMGAIRLWKFLKNNPVV